ncbi:MAG: winged helix-turn-helix transcriptional regulator [Candidatus Aenigmarchaeota archaeon]|nr:winged helix-turn-helix transcriptional regulator [Candidatus Aenigmarchaeota archaeon]
MNVLKKSDSGIWIRELARQTNIPVATVYYYLNKFISDRIVIENAKFGGIEHSQMKIVRLKNEE